MSTDNTVKEIIQTAVETAKDAKYCRNCHYSYFIGLQTDKGYCKYGRLCLGAPKVIDEFAVCKRWKAKPMMRRVKK